MTVGGLWLGRALGRAVAIGAMALGVAAVALAALPLPASAATPTVTITPAGDIYNGEAISVSVGPNSLFPPHTRVNVLECADPDGTKANLPTDISPCDGNTIQGGTVLVGPDGSFTVSGYTVYQLPSLTLGEHTGDLPICNASNSCALFVGEDQNNFLAAKVFSSPFLVGPAHGGTAAASPASAVGTSGAAASDPSAKPTSEASNQSSTPSVSIEESGGGAGLLAHTGADLLFIVGLAIALILSGMFLRRAVLRGTS